MKKNFLFAIMSAIALTGAVSFSACSSSDDVIDNPDYNPETNTVKTTITLSVNPSNGGVSNNVRTRQTANIAQVEGAFRGITNMILVPSSAAITTDNVTTSKIALEDFTFDESTSHKLYANKDVAMGVSQFLFLGKAKNNAATSSSTVTEKLASGYTTNNFATAATVGAISVNPEAIATTTGDWTTKSSAIATYLGTIASATDWSTNENTSLRDMYSKFTRTTNTAGSASAVLLTLQDLYRKIEAVATAQATTVSAIRTAITAQTDVTGTGTEATLAWNSACTFKDFPTDLGLPEGSAQYKYNTANSTFEYVTDGSNATATAVEHFVYPNELYYLTNTPIKASSSKNVTWPASVDAWKSNTWTDWDNSVGGSTKNVALKYNVQYGTALLSTQVKCAATTLYDNAKLIAPNDHTANQAIDITNNKFQLTGVIVGGQPTSVGWNFLPTSGATFTNAIYDRMTGVDVGTTLTTANYTLVFDDDKTSDEKDINICLEFLNNSGVDFYGKDGIILKGQKFYLVGKLNVTTGTNPFEATGNDAIGTDEAEATYFPSRAKRAFIQDFTTKAEFTITAGSADGTTAGSLTKAMSTIPDLRASQQTIGLSVDVTWRTGLTYTSNLGE